MSVRYGSALSVSGQREALEIPLRDAARAIQARLGPHLQRLAQTAREIVPVRTGALRDSLRTAGAKEGGAGVEGEVVADAPHAGVAQWGRSSGRAGLILEAALLEPGTATETVERFAEQTADDLADLVAGGPG